MSRILMSILMLVAGAAADRGSELAIASAMREYYGLLGASGDGGIDSIRDRIVSNLAKCRPKTVASVVRQLNKGFEAKYKKSAHFHKCLAQAMASETRSGIPTLYRRYKSGSSKKRPDLRRGIAEALGECGHVQALGTLLKITHDNTPEVAAAAVTASAAYTKIKGKKRKDVMRKLIDRYMQVSDKAAGKKPESNERKLYAAVDSAMKSTLKAFSRGESLDSALAWDAWWRDRATKPWED